MDNMNYPPLALLLAMEAARVPPSDLAAPDFAKAERVHDWRNYVPDEVRAAWPSLDDTARIAVYLTANARAMAEEWE